MTKETSLTCLAELAADARRDAEAAGMAIDEKGRSGSFFQEDHSVIFEHMLSKGLEIMDIDKARKMYPWLKEYEWTLVDRNKDEYTKMADERPNHGYFIRALPGVKTSFPLQACLYIGKDGLAQCVHNIIIAEEGSQLDIITGCTSKRDLSSGLHVGISEFFVKKNAVINFTMIHNWAEGMDVRPRSGARVEENGVFVSNYVTLNPLKTLQMYPTARCVGKNAIVRFNSIIRGRGKSLLDVGSRVLLEAEGSRAEMLARSIAEDEAQVISRGHMVGSVPGVKGHLECNGLLLSDKASIKAVPELEGKSPDIELSHEAAVGKLAPEEIRYLMARGLDEDTAKSVLIRGFLKVELPGMPEELRKRIDAAIEASSKGL